MPPYHYGKGKKPTAKAVVAKAMKKVTPKPAPKRRTGVYGGSRGQLEKAMKEGN